MPTSSVTRCCLVSVVALAVFAATASPQMQWSERITHWGRGDPGIAFDPVNGKPLIFGGQLPSYNYQVGTWQLDGDTWQRLSVSGPSPRYGSRMITDWANNRVLLEGGQSLAGTQSDLWSWDGTAWTQLSPTSGWPAIYEFAYDLSRNVVVGVDNSIGMVYEFDGSQWTQHPQVVPGGGVAPRSFLCAFDVAVGVAWIVEENPSRIFRFDGQQIIDVTPAQQVPIQGSSALFYDPVSARTILYQRDTTAWTFDGAAWSPLSVPQGPAPDPGYADIVTDWSAGRVLLRQDVGPTWVWDGAQWTVQAAGAPGHLDENVVHCFDSLRERQVVYDPNAGGRVWEWDAERWHVIPTTSGPPLEPDARLVYDAARGEALFMGERNPGMWSWDGQVWRQVSVGFLPLIAQSTDLVFDEGRDVVVAIAAGSGGQTWEWDGIRWQQRAVFERAPSGSGRYDAAWYDRVRGRVMCAVPTTAGAGETWEWDGAAWSMVTPSWPGFDGKFAYDRTRNQLVVVGCGGIPVWEWDGQAWSQGTASGLPGGVFCARFVCFDGRRVVIRPSGGGFANVQPPLDQFYAYEPVAPASVEPMGAGCAGSAGVPELAEASIGPWRGRPFELQLSGAPANAAAGLLLGVCTGGCPNGTYPLPLIGLGMPGCQLHLEPLEFCVTAAGANGEARWTLPVANSPSLVGLEVYVQALVSDPGVNRAGFAASGALRATIGTF